MSIFTKKIKNVQKLLLVCIINIILTGCTSDSWNKTARALSGFGSAYSNQPYYGYATTDIYRGACTGASINNTCSGAIIGQRIGTCHGAIINGTCTGAVTY